VSFLSRLTIGLVLGSVSVAPVSAAVKDRKEREASSPAQHQTALDAAGIERLKSEVGNRAFVTVSRATGAARVVGFAPGSHGDLAGAVAQKSASVEAKAASFLENYKSVFGLESPASELAAKGETRDALGATHLSFNQVYQGVPVFAGVLRAHFAKDGSLVAVNGNVVPNISLDTRPTWTADEASRVALAEIAEQTAGAPGITVESTKLYVFRTNMAKGIPGLNYLAWEVTVTNGADVREMFYVDAHTGKIVDQITGVMDGLTRRAYDGGFLPAVPPTYPGTPFWVEGQPFPTGNAEADNMLVSSKETYDFYKNAFGRDSFDGNGATMDSIFNRGYSCPNASWNGTFISFCQGLTTDDVTAHEWTHAYTQYTHGLIYQWQSGALNESYSDIFGETIDRINDRDAIGNSGTDAPRTGVPCTSFTPARSQLVVNAPAGVAGTFPAQTAGFGTLLTATGPITGNAVVALDAADGAGPATNDGCSAITNPAEVAGKIAIVYRGTCNFSAKVYNAQLAGAVAVIVVNNVATGLPGMGAGVNAALVTIPSIGITKGDGDAIVAALASGPVNVTLRATTGVTDNSTRWLLGEDSTAAGLTGALRDMYNPNCYGNPGKVTDPAFYVCGPGTSANDNGGVHTNSGVPNHAFALIVDGGAYNGQTIAGIGLTKAAHVYFRAMSVYQHATSDFLDHADAIEQAAADLVGANLNDLSTGLPSGQSLTAADLAEIHKAMVATEMRTPPAFCNFTATVLGKNPPPDPACGVQTVKRTLFADDFEGDTSAWTIGRLSTSPTFSDRDWTVSTLPDRSGKGFFASDPNTGNCASVNETGVMTLTSPAIQLPAGVSSGPTLTFDHYVSTEASFDGGQLLISVNGGAFTLVPQAAYIYNAPNATLTTGSGSTNPRRGQRAWQGTDDGTHKGSWGKTLVNLSALAPAGSTIQLRWDLSSDCASGRIGWYLDNVNLYDCEPDADGDGVRDADDECAGTSLLQAVVIIGTGKFSNTGVPNTLLSTGCTLQQKIDECAANNIRNHGGFVSCVDGLTTSWVAAGIITDAQKGAIMRAAAQAR
jgi:Zn-dependent metalloprotease